jgi:DNA-binding CsgD family transcriptional regulator
VLSFVARRLAGSRVSLLVAARLGSAGFFEASGLTELVVPPLDDDAAGRLLAAAFPLIAGRVRQRVLDTACGNPLALLELPGSLTGHQLAGERPLPTTLMLSSRLQELYASQLATLPDAASLLILLAALDGTGDLRLLQGAMPEASVLDRLAPAEQARLVVVDPVSKRLSFRHPLIASAVVQHCDDGDRRAAHRLLADLLRDDAERHALHLAEAAIEPDEHVALLLERAARIALARGEADRAVANLGRSAELSPSGAEKGRRLALAACLKAGVTADLVGVSQLLNEAERSDPRAGDSLAAAMAASGLLLNGKGDVDTAHRLLLAAIEAALDSAGPEDSDIVPALHTLMLICFFGGEEHRWVSFNRAVARLESDDGGTLRLGGSTFADPIRAELPVLGQLDEVIGALGDELDPSKIVRVSVSAIYVDRLAGCRRALWRVVHEGRSAGAIASAIDALMLLAFDAYFAGQWTEAEALASDGLDLCVRHGYRLLEAPGHYCLALLAAGRGDHDEVQSLTTHLMAWASPRGIGAVQKYCDHIRGLEAVGGGDVEAAFGHASAISAAGTFAPHCPHALWVMLDLVEAAVRSNRRADAVAHVRAMRESNVQLLSPRLALVVGASAALAAEAELAGELFRGALEVPDVERWPFDLARVQLAYGEHLRRVGDVAVARIQLSGSLDTFERLGAEPWSARAREELRATGQPSTSDRWQSAPLNPLEREIALLAAGGMTNKEIGQRLCLSHRTVGAHLYQIFPKLGITSRAALRDALDPEIV